MAHTKSSTRLKCAMQTIITRSLAYGHAKSATVDVSGHQKHSGMLASAMDVRRSLGSFSFPFCFYRGFGERHSVNFEFEISRYAAVVGKSRVCLSLVTSQTRLA